MTIEKPFLDPGLTLSGLAGKLGMTTNHLSQVINSRFDVNFHTYINRYRIETAKKILQETTEKGVLDAAFQSGFNSVSAFYAAFKKHTGITPADFRKKPLSKG
ncbi:MAG: helix-turn-helix domain-containing protein [Desulfobacterales bacterium]|nr:helix-turn-helix domain-containing protein [Desulfobacterales bacterium]